MSFIPKIGGRVPKATVTSRQPTLLVATQDAGDIISTLSPYWGDSGGKRGTNPASMLSSNKLISLIVSMQASGRPINPTTVPLYHALYKPTF